MAKCDHPFWVFNGVHAPDHNVDRVPVPCGKCPSCKKRRVDQWTFRLLQEQKVQDFCHFVTFTYDTRSVPISSNGFMTLDRGEFPRFMKRLRKLLPNVSIKYYYCGEYGTQRRRPHYHAIIFGVEDPELYHKAWSLGSNSLGDVVIGTVTGDSIAYVMKYIDKGSFRPMHGRDDRVPEFSMMSKGLGLSYVTPAVKDYHQADLSRIFCVKPGGYRVSMPRYYRERIFSRAQRRVQLSIIQAAVSVAELTDRHNFDVLYPDGSITYAEYKERQKLGRISNFNSQIKSRDV